METGSKVKPKTKFMAETINSRLESKAFDLKTRAHCQGKGGIGFVLQALVWGRAEAMRPSSGQGEGRRGDSRETFFLVLTATYPQEGTQHITSPLPC